MAGILSTKKLSPAQRELLLNAGLSLVEYDFIRIVPIPFTIEQQVDNIIFTSKNAVKIVAEKLAETKAKNIFCVGNKTAAFLQDKGFEVKETADYGDLLAAKIIRKYRNEAFVFFCGKKKRPELPEMLRAENIRLQEVEVYDTLPVGRNFNRNFEGVLFFSPSAVRSYCEVNDLSRSTAFCIGKTTASEAARHTRNIKVANKPSIENVVVQVVKHFGNSRISS